MAEQDDRNPFSGLVDFFSEMNRAWDRAAGPQFGSGRKESRTHADAWTPNTDILACGSDLVVRCGVPGVRAEELEVTYAHSQLTIAGTTASEEEQKDAYYTAELPRGRFRRAITLSAEVTADELSVRLRNGIVEVTVPGAVDTAPKRLPVTETSSYPDGTYRTA